MILDTKNIKKSILRRFVVRDTQRVFGVNFIVSNRVFAMSYILKFMKIESFSWQIDSQFFPQDTKLPKIEVDATIMRKLRKERITKGSFPLQNI